MAAFPAGTQRAVLRLQAVREEDSGLYGCHALGQAGSAFHSTLLTVGSAPHFPEPLGDMEVKVGDSVSMLCRVEGSPLPQVTWSRQDGKPVVGWQGPRGVSMCTHLFVFLTCPPALRGLFPLEMLLGQGMVVPVLELARGSPAPPGDHYSIQADGSLHMDQASPGDAGTFTCEVTNALGSHRQDVSLVIHGESLPSSLPFPLQGTEPIPLSPHYQLDPDGTLLIPSSSSGDAGTYFCTATNAAGFSSREMQLSISTKPRISVNGSQASDPVTILAVLGQDTTLPCEVQGFPPPLVVWSREPHFSVPSPPRYSVLPSGSLHLAEPQVTDSGLYTCTATNTAGNASLSYSLNVQGSDTPPWLPQGSSSIPSPCPLLNSPLLALPAPFQVTRGRSLPPAPHRSPCWCAETGHGWWQDRPRTCCPCPSLQVAEGWAPCGWAGWCGGVPGQRDSAGHPSGAWSRRALRLPRQQLGRAGPGRGAGHSAR
uniref:Ig-like domain-containing protein n=1 Tax=Cyanoderma ruficeps TaxID=181631 RepID=A0A8C3NN22_9PASS